MPRIFQSSGGLASLTLYGHNFMIYCGLWLENRAKILEELQRIFFFFERTLLKISKKIIKIENKKEKEMRKLNGKF